MFNLNATAPTGAATTVSTESGEKVMVQLTVPFNKLAKGNTTLAYIKPETPDKATVATARLTNDHALIIAGLLGLPTALANGSPIPYMLNGSITLHVPAYLLNDADRAASLERGRVKMAKAKENEAKRTIKPAGR